MRLALVLTLALAAGLPAAEQKVKKQKPPEIEVVEAAARRDDGRIAVDARVRNVGEKPIQGLVVLFDFMAPGKGVVTTQRFEVEEDPLAPGGEASVHAVMVDAVRAVDFRINGADKEGRELRVARPGPFPIE